MRNKLRTRSYQVALLFGSLLTWELMVRSRIADEFFFSMPSAILLRVATWIWEGEIYRHLSITFSEILLAFAIGTVLGTSMGLWLALNSTARQILEPYIKAFNAIPRVVLAPIFTLWFGLGLLSKVALGVSLVFFLAFFNTYQGVREVNLGILANARMLGASQRQLLRHLYLPSAGGWILSSLRTSIGFAVVGAVVGEYMGAAAGLGYLIAQAEGVFDTTGVFAGMAILVLFVLILDSVVNAAGKQILAWRTTSATGGAPA